MTICRLFEPWRQAAHEHCVVMETCEPALLGQVHHPDVVVDEVHCADDATRNSRGPAVGLKAPGELVHPNRIGGPVGWCLPSSR
jgi:hypothetical protein